MTVLFLLLPETRFGSVREEKQRDSEKVCALALVYPTKYDEKVKMDRWRVL